MLLREDYVESSVSGNGKPALGDPAFEGSRDDAIDLAVAAWEAHSRDMHGICDRRSIAYLHVLQPTLFYAPAWPAELQEESDESVGLAWRHGVARGYPAMVEHGAALRESGIGFLDATGALGKNFATYYYDSCHFNEDGNVLLGQAIADALLELLAQRAGQSRDD